MFCNKNICNERGSNILQTAKTYQLIKLAKVISQLRNNKISAYCYFSFEFFILPYLFTLQCFERRNNTPFNEICCFACNIGGVRGIFVACRNAQLFKQHEQLHTV